MHSFWRRLTPPVHDKYEKSRLFFTRVGGAVKFLVVDSIAKRKDRHGVSSGWSSTWFHSNTGLSSTQYDQIPTIFGVWPFWLTPFFFPDDIFKCILFNENIWTSIKISLKFVPIDIITALVHIMAWCGTGDTIWTNDVLGCRLCVSRPQWVHEALFFCYILSCGDACWIWMRLTNQSCFWWRNQLAELNSLAPGRFWWNFWKVIFELISIIGDWNISGNKPLPEPMWTQVCVAIWLH